MFSIRKSTVEENLVKGCLNGDRKAQREVYERYAVRMLSLCCRYVSDKAIAEDVMVGGFLKVFGKISQYSGQGSFEGWIRRIMIREALTYLRRNQTMYLEVDIDKAAYDPDLGVLENHLHEDDLLAMVNRLPVGYRTIFNLYAIEGYSHKEIGEMLNINESTSKSQLSRARALLQKYLAEQEQALKETWYGAQDR